MLRGYIDLGHSGPFPADPGAIGPNGERESAIVGPIAEKIGHYLRVCGHAIVFSRDGERGKTLPLAARPEAANRIGADYLLSIHCNAGPASAHGFEVWTTPGQNKSDRMATMIYDAAPGFARAGVLSIRTDKSDGDPDKERHLTVLRLAQMPAVLLEMGFLTNAEDLACLQDPAWIDKAARLLAGAVDRFYKERQA